MEIIEKIRKEIESYRIKDPLGPEADGYNMALDDIVSFLDSLQEETPKDLRKELQEWVNLMVGASFPEQDGDFISEEDYRSVVRQTALHFYELGKNGK